MFKVHDYAITDITEASNILPETHIVIDTCNTQNTTDRSGVLYFH